MNIKVIFIPYWSFATIGLSLLQRLLECETELEGTDVHEGKHLPAERKWEGYDKKHKERHFCHEQEEDLGAIALAVSPSIITYASVIIEYEERSSIGRGWIVDLQDCNRASS